MASAQLCTSQTAQSDKNNNSCWFPSATSKRSPHVIEGFQTHFSIRFMYVPGTHEKKHWFQLWQSPKTKQKNPRRKLFLYIYFSGEGVMKAGTSNINQKENKKGREVYFGWVDDLSWRNEAAAEDKTGTCPSGIALGLFLWKSWNRFLWFSDQERNQLCATTSPMILSYKHGQSSQGIQPVKISNAPDCFWRV